jgi:hypothetical protein
MAQTRAQTILNRIIVITTATTTTTIAHTTIQRETAANPKKKT